jgi:hypothetical protein
MSFPLTVMHQYLPLKDPFATIFAPLFLHSLFSLLLFHT